jgi:uncharacterized protein involved in exopolysaccharide biosynthesis
VSTEYEHVVDFGQSHGTRHADPGRREMNTSSVSAQSGVTVGDALGQFWAARWAVFITSLSVGLLAGVACLTLKPVYRAEVILSPVSNNAVSGGLKSMSGVLEQFGGLAALGGISLPTDSDNTEAIATLTSRSLVETFIGEEQLLPILFARNWDSNLHQFRGTWLHDSPTLWDGHKKFREDIMRVTEDKKAGVITLSIDWTNADLAAQWANGLVKRCNLMLRDRAIGRARSNIEYVEGALKQAGRVEVQDALYRIMETELKKIVLAEGTQEYAFRVIDPAVVPQERNRPKAALLVPLGLIAGAVLGFLGAMIRSSIAARRAYSVRGATGEPPIGKGLST